MPSPSPTATRRPLRMVSWNVNGLRAVMKKGFPEIFDGFDADIVALQETKLQDADRAKLDLELPGYHQTWNYAEKKGYSGTAVFSRQEPLSVRYGFEEDPDDEGRICALEFDSFWFVNVYTPNAQRELTRLDFRMAWDDAYRSFLCGLSAEKPVVTCGDLNVAHNEIDLKNPEAQPRQRRLHRRGARQVHRAARRRLHRHLPPPAPRCDRGLQLVELHASTRARTTRAGASTTSS